MACIHAACQWSFEAYNFIISRVYWLTEEQKWQSERNEVLSTYLHFMDCTFILIQVLLFVRQCLWKYLWVIQVIKKDMGPVTLYSLHKSTWANHLKCQLCLNYLTAEASCLRAQLIFVATLWIATVRRMMCFWCPFACELLVCHCSRFVLWRKRMHLCRFFWCTLEFHDYC